MTFRRAGQVPEGYVIDWERSRRRAAEADARREATIGDATRDFCVDCWTELSKRREQRSCRSRCAACRRKRKKL